MVNPLNSIDTLGAGFPNKLNSSKKSYYGNRRPVSRTNQQFPRNVTTPKKININEIGLYGFTTVKTPPKKSTNTVSKKLTLSLSALESGDINEFLNVGGLCKNPIENDGNTPCTSAESPLLSQASPQCTISLRHSQDKKFFGNNPENVNQNVGTNAYLIWTAMRSMKRNKITLTSIYRWIKDNFAYYRDADFNWQVGSLVGLSALLRGI